MGRGGDGSDNKAGALRKPLTSSRDALRQARSIRDDLGRGLDPEMTLPIAALIRMGIRTSGSCSGHPDHGSSYPWIDVEAGAADRAGLSRMLPGFHLVKRGSEKFPDSFRIQPREISNINSPDPGGQWKGHLEELQTLAQAQLLE